MRKNRKNLSRFFAAILSAVLIGQPTMSAFAEIDGMSSTAGSVGMDDSGDIALTSLLPLEEEYVYLYMNGYTEEELEAVPVATVLENLVDYSGNPVTIPEDAKIVWTTFPDENGDIVYDSHKIISRDGSVNMNFKYYSSCDIQMIVGSGKQLDPANIRYNIDVRFGELQESFRFTLYDKETERELRSQKVQIRDSYILEDLDIPVTSVHYIARDYAEGKDYSLEIDLDWREREHSQSDIDLEIYPMKNFADYLDGQTLTGEITDSLIEAEDDLNDYYSGKFSGSNTMENYRESDNLFCFVYRDTMSGAIIGYQGVELVAEKEPYELEAALLVYEDDEMMSAAEDNYVDSRNSYSLYLYIDLEDESENKVYASYSYRSIYFELKDNYSAEDDFYLAMTSSIGVEKAVAGTCWSFADAERYTDITDDLFVEDDAEAPFGYSGNFIRKYITVFFKDGTFQRYYTYVYGGTEYDSEPVINGTDPYFRVKGAVDTDSNAYDAFAVSNSYDETLDTLYGYGYQTVLLLDKDADLAHLKPTFWTPDDVKVHVGEEQISGESEQDFSNGSVFYTAHIGDKLKNYNVTFKKRTEGPKLFVNGPKEREVFLNNYTENRHDILIANIGDEELTGLEAELIDAQNVMIDRYWTFGGEDNDTLAAFESTNRYYMANLAKIRLIATYSNASETDEGEAGGEVSGKLKISADGQEPVYIKLKGYAGNPKIITETMSNAVKYVPYSYVISTSNMYDWNKVTFSLYDGELPEGMKLYSSTGEIYGVPLETGEFPITVKASYSESEFEPSYEDFVLKVVPNTGKNVHKASDKGYEVKEFIGEKAGSYDYVLNEIKDQTFVSKGEYDEFIDFWFNGKKLKSGVDYESESGSTRITIKSQTFRANAVNGTNTIAAEFRVDGDKSKEMKRTAQNFRMNISTNDDDDNDDDRNDENQTTNGDSSTTSDWQAYQYDDTCWIRDEKGWRVKNPDGTWLVNTWAQLPYLGTLEWYYIGADGYMKAGWFLDVDGRWYYLHPVSDGTMGRMYYGWHQIDAKWYYFNEVSDGTKGSMRSNMWIGEYFVDENGVWTE